MKGGKLININEEDLFLDKIEEKIFMNIRDSLINQGCVFFGAFANRLYLKTLHIYLKKIYQKFLILMYCLKILKEHLEY